PAGVPGADWAGGGRLLGRHRADRQQPLAGGTGPAGRLPRGPTAHLTARSRSLTPMSSVPTEDRLGELLLRWDELRRQGRDIPAGELCVDCPELADELRRRIEVVRDLEPVLDIEPTHLVVTPGDGGPGGSRSDRRLPEDLHATAVYRPQRYHAQGGLGEVLAARQKEL